jgi:hypothetical protein
MLPASQARASQALREQHRARRHESSCTEGFVTECRADEKFRALQPARSKAGTVQSLVMRYQLVCA